MANNLFSALERITDAKNAPIQEMAEMFGLSVNAVIDEIPVLQLKEKSNHPFKVSDDDRMKALAKSIQTDGQLEPIIVRRKDEYYEILAGHRRTYAAKSIGKQTMRAIVVNVDDITANRILINSNLPQREYIYPSERAKSYRLRYEDLKQERKQNSDRRNFEKEKKLADIMAEEFNVSKSSVYLHLRFCSLTDKLLEKLDDKILTHKTAEQLSYLSETEQKILYSIVYEECICLIDAEQAALLRKEHEKHEMNRQTILKILSPKPKEKKYKYFSGGELDKYREKFATPTDMEKAIIQFLENY